MLSAPVMDEDVTPGTHGACALAVILRVLALVTAVAAVGVEPTKLRPMEPCGAYRPAPQELATWVMGGLRGRGTHEGAFS